MKRQYLLYLTLIPIIYLIYSVHTSYRSASAFFYGFAENKETELSHESDVLVSEIFVTQGESVKEGQVLMKVSRPELTVKEADANIDEATTVLKLEAEKDKLLHQQAKISSEEQSYLRQKAAEKTAIVNREKQNLKELSTLKSVEVDVAKISQKAEAQLAAIDAEILDYSKESSMSRQQLQKQIKAIEQSLAIASKKVDIEKEQIATAYKELEILAPANGVIGNIQSKKGEHVKSHTTLMTFYEENPSIVKGYVHENFILHVHKGDSLTISSTLRPEHVTQGEVVGLGSRIVEIPERLRKIPTVKTYGREVLVKIPSTNRFLQKEKVSINSTAVSSAFTAGQKNKKWEKELTKELSIK